MTVHQRFKSSSVAAQWRATNGPIGSNAWYLVAQYRQFVDSLVVNDCTPARYPQREYARELHLEVQSVVCSIIHEGNAYACSFVSAAATHAPGDDDAVQHALSQQKVAHPLRNNNVNLTHLKYS